MRSKPKPFVPVVKLHKERPVSGVFIHNHIAGHFVGMGLERRISVRTARDFYTVSHAKGWIDLQPNPTHFTIRIYIPGSKKISIPFN